MLFCDNLIHTIGKRTILVIEDSKLNRMVLQSALENDYIVLQAENGLIGLELLEKHHQDISLILLDVYMPECDGFEFLRRKNLDERYSTIPVIVATASGSLEDEIKCLELGANDFIVKPYSHDVMLNRMSNTIRLRESAAIVNLLKWDRVTGLYSKEFFYSAVEEVLCEFPDTEYDLVCSDIENFKALNDRYGEKNYNYLLRELTNCTRDILPSVAVGGRIGCNTFAYLIEHQQPGWEGVLHSITDCVSHPNLIVKFGIVKRIDRALTVPKICYRAISALETIKGRHGIDIALFDDEVHQQQLIEQTIRESMQEALEGLQFSVFYQPKYDVRASTVGGAEALVRWNHPAIGLISPNVFIPLFEHNGFITKLDYYVWEEACKEIKRCADLGLPTIPISVNASRIDFDVPDLPDRIAALADKYDVDHSLLHIELTETAYSDNPATVTATLKRLKELGFPTALDDFGAGYSALVSLNTLPLDVMKLDVSMIRKAAELNDYRIVESTIQLAHILGLQTVVEGVETADEAQKVSEMGCDFIQGFYYSKPLPREDFEEYLRQFMR